MQFIPRDPMLPETAAKLEDMTSSVFTMREVIIEILDSDNNIPKHIKTKLENLHYDLGELQTDIINIL
jgi:hypothetical protein